MYVCLWVYSCTCTIFHLILTKYLQRKEWWYFLLLFLRRVRHFFLHTNALLFLMQSLSKCAVPPKWELHPTFLLWGLRALTFRACLYKYGLYFPLPPRRQREQTIWSCIHCIYPVHHPQSTVYLEKPGYLLKPGWNLRMCWGKKYVTLKLCIINNKDLTLKFSVILQCQSGLSVIFWAYVSRDHSGRCRAWGSLWLRKAQGQEKWQFPALINECTGRSFCLQDQRPADTCSGTEKIINKDPAFVSSWAPLNLFDLDEEEKEIVNITLWRFSVKSLHSCGTAVRNAGTWASSRYHDLRTLPIRHFFSEANIIFFLIQSSGFLMTVGRNDLVIWMKFYWIP